MHIDFNATFYCVSHSGLLYKVRDGKLRGAVFDINAVFFSGNV